MTANLFVAKQLESRMFSRVASTVARAPVRAAARRLSSRSAQAAVSAQGSSAAFGLAAAGALAVAAGAIAYERPSAAVLCDHASFKYTGIPGTDHERSFIVSLGVGV